MVPVDFCINMLICCAWNTAGQKPDEPIKVYNCTSGGLHPVTWGQVEVWGLEAIMKAAYEGVLWLVVCVGLFHLNPQVPWRKLPGELVLQPLLAACLPLWACPSG